VGITFGSGSGFPAPWQDRLFLADWAYGRISTMDLKAQGAGYQGTSHDFLSGKPLNVTDLEFGPDGALWFITGGRGTQSGLYRVTYSGASTPNPPSAGPAPNAETLVRRALERDEVSFEETMLLLGSEDRVLRFAARLNLERRPHSTWMESLKSMEASLALGELLLAAARIGDAEQREEVRSRILTWNFKEARPEVQWLLVRTAMLLRTRGGAAEQLSEDPGIASYFASAFPTRDVALNREIARLLVAVQAPGLPAILLQQMDLADFQEEKLHYALLLRLVEQDWDEELRLRYLTWLRHARSLPGGLSVAGFLSAMESDALSHLDTEARGRLLALLEPLEPSKEFTPSSPREFHHAWTVADGLAALDTRAESQTKNPQGTLGKEMFRDLSCIQCHRFGTEGGSLGPDLGSVAHRFGRRDLLEAILVPQKAVSDQYTLVPMPSGLLDTATAEELTALIHYLEAGPPADS
jgi:cytochrome c551/c552